MDTTPRLDDAAPKTAANKRRRQTSEAAMLAEADAEIAAGLTVDEAEVDAWIDSLGTDRELPKPKPGH
jgi:predicted transcriptional regulator